MLSGIGNPANLLPITGATFRTQANSQATIAAGSPFNSSLRPAPNVAAATGAGSTNAQDGHRAIFRARLTEKRGAICHFQLLMTNGRQVFARMFIDDPGKQRNMKQLLFSAAITALVVSAQPVASQDAEANSLVVEAMGAWKRADHAATPVERLREPM